MLHQHRLEVCWGAVGLAAVLCAGCLPSSCQRRPPRTVSPTDSLSRQIAAGVQADTLLYDGELTPPEDYRLEYPRTVLFTDQGGLVVSDAVRNSLFRFDSSGAFLQEVSWDGASIPYLADSYGDTTIVFSAGSGRIDYIAGDAPIQTISVLREVPRGALQYATATGEGAYLKIAGKEVEPSLFRFDLEGRVLERRILPGSTWRNAGALRLWGEDLLSLSGYFPIVDVLPRSLRGPADSLVLLGFDSPMLARTYAFTQGDGRGAPLLTSAAAPGRDHLFVLNLRPGWLQIDVYDRSGQLNAVLLEPNPGYNREYYPIDVAVRRAEHNEWRIAVAIIKPDPAVRLYRWLAPAFHNHTLEAALDP